jgi:hypothetical protein
MSHPFTPSNRSVPVTIFRVSRVINFDAYTRQGSNKPYLKCDLCVTFWKYNLIQHMLEYHLDNGKLPPFPSKLRVSSHISHAEEESMGVEFMKTMDYRNRYNLPNTSDITPSHSAEQEQSHRRDFSMDGEPEGRKRTFSVLSQTSTTASRMPPYSKTQCM